MWMVCASCWFNNDPAVGGRLLGAGATWDGAGWTTGRASRVVYGATGVAMVEEDLKHYLESFLFALSLVYNIDIPKLQLKPQAADVALKFADQVQRRGEVLRGVQSGEVLHGVQSGNLRGTPEFGAVEEAKSAIKSADSKPDLKEESEPMAWELTREDLPEDLNQVHTRFQNCVLQLDAKQLLDSMPLWKAMKDKSETKKPPAGFSTAAG